MRGDPLRGCQCLLLIDLCKLVVFACASPATTTSAKTYVCKSCYYYICEDICVLCAISRGHMRLEVPAQLPVPHEHSTVRATPLSEKRRAASRVSLCKDVTARVLLFRVSTPTAYTAHCPTTPAQLGPHGLSLPRKRPIAALPRKRPIAAA